MIKGLFSITATLAVAIAMMVNGATFAELREFGTLFHLSAHSDQYHDDETAQEETHVHKHRHAPNEPEHEHQHTDLGFFGTVTAFHFPKSNAHEAFEIDFVQLSLIAIDEDMPVNRTLSSLLRPPIV